MLGRREERDEVRSLLRSSPVVGILGPRQVGKTTLALDVAARFRSEVHRFDLEHPRDLRRLDDESTALEGLRGLVVIDEIQRRPQLFPFLRVLADRPRTPARFLVLGSASPEFLQQSAESLAGRIAFVELAGFSMGDVGADRWRKLWLRGGFPRSWLARSDAMSLRWREDLSRTYLERDLRELGVTIPSATMGRFWSMLAHYHGQTWNSAEFARAFGISESTVRRYLDLLAGTFMVRVLPAWSENLGKRQVKTPKVYVADSGILHMLLGIANQNDLAAHPKVGASFEGFAIDQVIRHLKAKPRECYFWATHQGAELDLVIVRGKQRLGFEIKHTNAPEVTRSMQIAMDDLKLDRLDVVHVGPDTYPLTPSIRAVAIQHFARDIESR